MIIDTPHGPTLGWWDRHRPTTKTTPTMKPANTDTLRPGSKVLVEGVPATVTANTIRQDISGRLFVAALEVAYWDGRVRHCETIEPWEATPFSDIEPIGFHEIFE